MYTVAIDSRYDSADLSHNLSYRVLFEFPMIGQYNDQNMRVFKRGTRGYEPIYFDKIAARLTSLANGLDVNISLIAQETIASIYDGIHTTEIDSLSAYAAESRSIDNPDYGVLASRITVSNMHKSTPGTFSDALNAIQSAHNFINPAVIKFVAENADAINNMIDCTRDYQYSYFGLTTVINTYLIKATEPALNIRGEQVYIDRNGRITTPTGVQTTLSGRTIARYTDPSGKLSLLLPKMQEVLIDRPQYMHMRVAIAVGGQVSDDGAHDLRATEDVLADIKQHYDDLSLMYYTHATPTCLNACRNIQQLNSCFLLPDADDEKTIMKIASDVATISKMGGGIGVHKQMIRASGQIIRSTGGKASGIVPQIKIINEVGNTFDQGGKRKGAVATYNALWQADIMQFLELRLNNGAEDNRARAIFLGLWVPDLFRVRWATGGLWSLFSADTAPALVELYDGMTVCKKTGHCDNPSYNKWFGECAPLFAARPLIPTGELSDVPDFVQVDAFTAAYEYYEENGYALAEIDPAEVIGAIIKSQRETGMPYIMSADSVNCSSTYRGVGTVTGSNLCTEIVEWCSSESYACCTLASMNLNKFVVTADNNVIFDHDAFHAMCRKAIRNLDNVINIGCYPVKECKNNADSYRPVALGIQGLANVFAKMRIPFDSADAARIELEIFETMYHASVTESAHLARERGSHVTFATSPAAAGLIAPDLWLQNQRRLSALGAKLASGGHKFPGNTPGYLEERFNSLFSGRYDMDALRALAATGQRNITLNALMPTATTSTVMGNVECFEPFGDNIYSRVIQHGKFLITNKEMIKHLGELGLWNTKLKMQIINNRGSIVGLGLPDEIVALYKTVSEISQALIIERAALRGAFVDQSQSMNLNLQSTSSAVFRGVMWKGFATGVKTCSYYTRSTPAVDAMKNNISASAALGIETTNVLTTPPDTTQGPTCSMEDGCLFCSS